MKSLKLTLGIALATTGLGGALVVGATASNTFSLKQAQASITMTKRRVYVINNTVADGAWYKWESGVYLYNTADDSWTTMTMLFSDYCSGLFYADIDYVPAGNKIIISGQNSWGGNGWQSEDITLATFGTADVLKFDPHYSNTKYSATVTDAGVGEGQMQWLLSFFDACSPNSYNGYGAYAQLKANFLDPTDNAVKNSSALVRKDGEHEDTDISIVDKLAALEERYNAIKD